jgi:hypothetical protein
MAKRRPRKPRAKAATSDYTDADGNVLTLRRELSRGSIRKIGERPGSAAASIDDAWQRREEALFERLAVRWVVMELPIEEQGMLLGRYRMASPDERRWVRETIDRHVAEFFPELA